jgi:hypothetical protein
VKGVAWSMAWNAVLNKSIQLFDQFGNALELVNRKAVPFVANLSKHAPGDDVELVIGSTLLVTDTDGRPRIASQRVIGLPLKKFRRIEDDAEDVKIRSHAPHYSG